MINHLGIISFGSIGKRHLKIVKNVLPNSKITVVRTSKKKESINGLNDFKICYNIEDAISQGIQAAIIASPAIYHVKQAIQLLQKNIHVLIEKPLSSDIDNMKELLNLSKNKKVVSLIGYCFRYEPSALYYKNIIKEKKYGKILRVYINSSSFLPDWRINQDYRSTVSSQRKLGGGVLNELSHELDFVFWYFGGIEKVVSFLKNSGTLKIDVEDSADILLKMTSNFNVYIHLNFNSKNIKRECITTFENGELIWNIIEKEVLWKPLNGKTVIKNFNNNINYKYIKQFQHFTDCIDKKSNPLVNVEDGIKVVNLIQAAKNSSINGKVEKL